MTYHELRRLKTEKYTNGSIDFDDSRHVNIYLKPFALNTSKDREDHSPIMKSTQGFVLDGDRAVKDFMKYNALKDKHLVHHFANKRKRKVLTSNQLITKHGHIIERKTCVENYDKIQASKPEDTFYYHQVRGGTLILGSQLPKVREKSNPKASFHDPTRLTEYHRQKSLKGVFPTTPQLPHRTHTAKSKSPQPKTPQRTTFYYNIQVQDESATTPITRKTTVEEAESPSPKTIKTSKSSKTLHTNLKPVSKDELNSIFSIYKKRLETSKELIDGKDLSPTRSPELKRPKKAVVHHFRTLSAITNQGTSPSPQLLQQQQVKKRDQTPEATSISITQSQVNQQKIETKFGRNLRIKHVKNSKSNDNLYKHSRTAEAISSEEPSTIKISQIISNHNQTKWFENKIDLMDSCPPNYFEGSLINPVDSGDNQIEKSISISGIQARDDHITLNSYDELK